MSLLGLGIAAAGIYGLTMAWSEMSTESARKFLHMEEAQKGHVDVIEHFDKIVRMVDVKPIDGILPKDGYKECQDLMMCELMYVTDQDLKKFKNHYEKVRREQIKIMKKVKKDELKELEEDVKFFREPELPGKYKRYDRFNSYESVTKTIHRCERLYRETPWGKIAKHPAKIIETPDGRVKEMWMLKHNFQSYDKIYRKCNKYLGYNVY